jgi:3-oxoacyl-[acyl-carrier-protein] synthase III
VNKGPAAAPSPGLRFGVRIAGSGSCLPEKRITNKDLEAMMDTNDEWIVQRTGVRERRQVSANESTKDLAAGALINALADARMSAKDLDLIITATMSPEMPCPPTSCLVANIIGAGTCGAMDLNVACSGFVYGMNIAHDLIKGGAYRSIAVIGADTLTKIVDYSTYGRGTAIIFGDGAGAAILRATDDGSQGILAQSMHSDGRGWKEIFVPQCDRDYPEASEHDSRKLGKVQMNGAAVFKFAVTTFSDLIQETLDKAGLTVNDVDHFVCHQSNARILGAARERFGLSEEKLYVNIDRVGNTVAASVPLCLDELRRAGRIKDGQKIMFLAFGGGLTWSSSLWQL